MFLSLHLSTSAKISTGSSLLLHLSPFSLLPISSLLFPYVFFVLAEAFLGHLRPLPCRRAHPPSWLARMPLALARTSVTRFPLCSTAPSTPPLMRPAWPAYVAPQPGLATCLSSLAFLRPVLGPHPHLPRHGRLAWPGCGSTYAARFAWPSAARRAPGPLAPRLDHGR